MNGPCSCAERIARIRSSCTKASRTAASCKRFRTGRRWCGSYRADRCALIVHRIHSCGRPVQQTEAAGHTSRFPFSSRTRWHTTWRRVQPPYPAEITRHQPLGQRGRRSTPAWVTQRVCWCERFQEWASDAFMSLADAVFEKQQVGKPAARERGQMAELNAEKPPRWSCRLGQRP